MAKAMTFNHPDAPAFDPAAYYMGRKTQREFLAMRERIGDETTRDAELHLCQTGAQAFGYDSEGDEFRVDLCRDAMVAFDALGSPLSFFVSFDPVHGPSLADERPLA